LGPGTHISKRRPGSFPVCRPVSDLDWLYFLVLFAFDYLSRIDFLNAHPNLPKRKKRKENKEVEKKRKEGKENKKKKLQ
jgi:uncharacterized protein YbgA (DUF1722 family)